MSNTPRIDELIDSYTACDRKDCYILGEIVYCEHSTPNLREATYQLILEVMPQKIMPKKGTNNQGLFQIQGYNQAIEDLCLNLNNLFNMNEG